MDIFDGKTNFVSTIQNRKKRITWNIKQYHLDTIFECDLQLDMD
jgi:hypothetical protein